MYQIHPHPCWQQLETCWSKRVLNGVLGMLGIKLPSTGKVSCYLKTTFVIMTTWIQSTARLQKCVEIINNLDASKFPLLLNRITEALQSESRKGKIFTDEEEEKLQTSLNLDQENLKLLLDCITVFVEQAAYHMTKPTVFQHTLIETFKMNEDKAETFSNIWTNSAKGIVDQLRRKSLFPAHLESVKWALKLQIASSTHSRQAIPKALFQLGIKGAKEEDGVNNINIEFNQEELFEFYKKLEKIQSQLDNLQQPT